VKSYAILVCHRYGSWRLKCDLSRHGLSGRKFETCSLGNRTNSRRSSARLHKSCGPKLSGKVKGPISPCIGGRPHACDVTIRDSRRNQYVTATSIMVTLRWQHLLFFLTFLSLSLAASMFQVFYLVYLHVRDTSLTPAQHRHPSANAPVSPTAPSFLFQAPHLIAKHPSSHLHSSLTEWTPSLKKLRRITLAHAPIVPSSSVCRITCLYALQRKRRTSLRLASRETASRMKRLFSCSLERRSDC
jgi:hypothetical protein